MSISDRLDQIEQRAKGATEGPWRSGHARRGRGQTVTNANGVPMFVNEREGQRRARKDADFIAAARTDVPALLTALRAVLDLHRPMTMYEHEDVCEDTSDEHCQARHVESESSYGEFFCLDLPTGVVLCAECSRDLDFDGRDYPCPTVCAAAAALGEDTP